MSPSVFLLPLVAKIRRTESVPSDINNPVDRPAEAPQFGTLPKALTKKVATHHCPVTLVALVALVALVVFF